MDHSLENLGPDRFQQLCQALIVREFPGTSCLPIGQPDGGRDAIQHPDRDGSSDCTVFQVKFCRAGLTGDDARRWVEEVTEDEVKKVKKLIDRGATKYIFITNVSGTAHLDVGSVDRHAANLRDKFGLPTVCWWRDDINRRLDGCWDLKFRYPDVLSGQDFLRLLLMTDAGQNQERRLNAIRAFIADQYTEDVEVKFKQVELQNKLLDLFVDLPFSMAVKQTPLALDALRAKSILPFRLSARDMGRIYSIEIAREDEDSTHGTATLLLSEFGNDILKQVVVEGAPGQGKSTLAQYLCQVHRIRWLLKTEDLTRIPSFHQQAALRTPFKVDLRDLATWLMGQDPFSAGEQVANTSGERTLEGFLSRLVRHHSGGVEFDVNDLLEVAKLTPLLIVLDGLDEVADVKRRAEVVLAVSKAIPRIQQNCGELRVVITSRPAAFANSPGFDNEAFPHIQLGSVTKAQLQHYAKKWMAVRSLSRRELKEFQDILDEKMKEPHLRDLARNPMQLTILLSLIHTQGAALPDRRTSLYDEYVRLFFSREASKNSAVRQHIELLKDLHRYLAWVLHISAETGRSKSGGRISANDLKSVLEIYLKREKHTTAVVDQVFGAMLERVVMIVPRVMGTYEFEIQPLREYFAARYLYDTASYSPTGSERTGTKPDRFDAIARNFYWLNVVRFFCGCFSKGELLDLADRLNELIGDSVFGKSKQSVRLSAMLLSDWVFTQSPRAVTEVARKLATPDALRRLLPHSTYWYGPDQIPIIPVRSGGTIILGAAYNALEDTRTRPDFRRLLSRFIRANSPADQIDAWWLEKTPPRGRTQQRWLSIGTELGSLQRLSKDAILTKISKIDSLDRSIISELYNAGRADCVLTSKINEARLTSHIMDIATTSHQYAPGVSPLFYLPTLLELSQPHAFRHLAANNSPILDSLNRFYTEAKVNGLPEGLCNLSQQAFEVSKAFSALVLENGPLSDSAFTWEPLVEECRSVWGDKPAILALANSISFMPRKPRRPRKKWDFFDHSKPISDRLRSAHANSRDVNWWRAQLGDAESSLDRLLFNMCLWTWASIDVLFTLAEELSAHLNAMKAVEWSTVWRLLSRFVGNSYISVSSGSGANEEVLQQLNSKRLALLIGMREPARYGRYVFLRYLADLNDDHIGFSSFRQIHAVEAALAHALDWDKALAIVRATYAQGAAHPLGRSIWPSRRYRLPMDVVGQLLSNAPHYPVYMWEMAESTASEAARKAVRPVASIAKAEKWF